MRNRDGNKGPATWRQPTFQPRAFRLAAQLPGVVDRPRTMMKHSNEKVCGKQAAAGAAAAATGASERLDDDMMGIIRKTTREGTTARSSLERQGATNCSCLPHLPARGKLPKMIDFAQGPSNGKRLERVVACPKRPPLLSPLLSVRKIPAGSEPDVDQRPLEGQRANYKDVRAGVPQYLRLTSCQMQFANISLRLRIPYVVAPLKGR
ncbi:hypothetical protein CMUS01_00875 [Colletotrichum musicola]|uniref:Uncharacterized protein n=1 Tax=Colletotrichum musicola TaxID=2175873 RepID=A0A8H6U911_9PEZI|nr:hypothetical protein CMUS01_00875 [Colletotrichum musicola]